MQVKSWRRRALVNWSDRFDDALEIVIIGTTAAGTFVRLSDWAERLCGMMSVSGEDRHPSCSPYLNPVVSAGVRCVVVVRELATDRTSLPDSGPGLQRDNELKLRPAHCARRQSA